MHFAYFINLVEVKLLHEHSILYTDGSRSCFDPGMSELRLACSILKKEVNNVARKGSVGHLIFTPAEGVTLPERFAQAGFVILGEFKITQGLAQELLAEQKPETTKDTDSVTVHGNNLRTVPS